MLVAPTLHEHIKHQPAPIDGAPEPVLHAGDLHGDPIEVLVEGAWTCRPLARMGEEILRSMRGLPEAVRNTAGKAQLRLCGRYRRLQMSGKPTNVATVAIASELAAFVWAIARMAAAKPAAV